MEERRIPLKSPRDHANDFRLDGKVAVVTGGGSGIGRAISLRFAASGAVVRVLDVNARDAEATCRLIEESGGIGSAHACDVTNQQLVKSTFEQLFGEQCRYLAHRHGGEHVGRGF